jgi:hypothetical protein
MPFALSPDEGPPYYGLARLIRFVTLESNVIAELDVKNNLLYIDKERWAKLTEEEQNTVLRTHAKSILMYETR